MSNKLYVGNLNYSVNADQLTELFAQAGNVVNVTVITDRGSGRSKGFGFVEMSNEEEAQRAIQMFNEQEFEQRKMIVSEARPQKPRESRPRGDFKRDFRKKDRY